MGSLGQPEVGGPQPMPDAQLVDLGLRGLRVMVLAWGVEQSPVTSDVGVVRNRAGQIRFSAKQLGDHVVLASSFLAYLQ